MAEELVAEEPHVVERAATPYVAITANVTMNDIGAVLPPLSSEVFEWLRVNGIAPVGAPFWKYDVIDMEHGLQVEVGVAVAEPADGDARVHAGMLPAGRYATVLHVGHPQTLETATARLLQWGNESNLKWDAWPTPQGERWECRLEIYHDEPGQPMDEWETELAFRLAD
ncbi:GyrI-like domain-containing protein [Humibacter sp. RRB41]|uniref:GyrI-like domain-containing protein n=1 Tax=Humibacter sp. RRB41 TaxID=2919946 RepID=UPI001FA9D171|nr:GyrI-like domain-containing protein [Humibacter sp. RRB41]